MQQTEAVLNLSITSDSTAMPLCRDTQANELLQLLNLHLASRNGGSIYISGLPGTGLILLAHLNTCALSKANTMKDPSQPYAYQIQLREPPSAF